MVLGTITFDGAQRGVVRNATVTGPGSGIVVDHGASVLIQDNTITANGDASDIYSPVAGSVVAVNEALEEGPDAVNSDPYGEGWLFKSDPIDASGMDQLLDSQAYREVCANQEH